MKRRLVRVVIWLSNLYRQGLVVLFAILGPTFAYRLSELLARTLYRLLPTARQLGEYHCRAALANQYSDRQIREIARAAFVHRIWNLVDLMLAKALMNQRSYRRFGGRLPSEHLDRLIAAQRQRKPTILVTAYYGAYDLLPVLLGFNGVTALIVYRPHANTAFDRFRQQVRGKAGCRFVRSDDAGNELANALAHGRTVALVADHHAERGISLDFLGLPTNVPRAIGLLAWRYEADVIVAALRRVGRSFRFEFDVVDILERPEIQAQPDPVDYTVRRYVGSLEEMILRDPAQYLWSQPRWGKDLARKVILGQAGPIGS